MSERFWLIAALLLTACRAEGDRCSASAPCGAGLVCQSASSCVSFFDCEGICMRLCTRDADCDPGWTCEPQPSGDAICWD
ncbi:MAG: hypothetical protein AAF411_13745 [Myxococcota bacterium]